MIDNPVFSIINHQSEIISSTDLRQIQRFSVSLQHRRA